MNSVLEYIKDLFKSRYICDRCNKRIYIWDITEETVCLDDMHIKTLYYDSVCADETWSD